MKKYIRKPQQYLQNQKHNRRFALLVVFALALILYFINFRLHQLFGLGLIVLSASASLALIIEVYWLLTDKYRKRQKILATPISGEWRKVLTEKVRFYRELSEHERILFEKDIQVFLNEKKIVGIDVKLSTEDKLLVAASAIIPIFRFNNWEYTNIKEVLIYPRAFDQNFQTTGTGRRSILGMVGTGLYRDIMILSLHDLRMGFSIADDRKNVGIHEFAHLLDLADGKADGVPELLLDNIYVMPWLKLIREEIKQIHHGKSDINPYGATNEAEFFAVLAEYFFENPGRLSRNHPQLYDMLERIFNYDMKNFFSDNFVRMKIRRNAPCPCGSGLKYKHCCGKK